MRVCQSVVVFHHPQHRGEAFDLQGQEGAVHTVLNDWKGRVISPNLPVIVKTPAMRPLFLVRPTNPVLSDIASLLLATLTLGPLNPAVAADVSTRGPLAVDTIEFADLVDALRKGPAADARNMRGAAGRRVPIKVHLPAGDGRLPVVVVSHGAGGDWDTHFGQAQHLASHGYAVLCLEHVGSNRAMVAGSSAEAATRITSDGLKPFLRGGVTGVMVLAK